MKFLIVNADDFGLSPGINRGIAQAYEHGIVTSASLLVHAPAAPAAAAYARARPGIGVGLHVDLGEWRYSEDGQWQQIYSVAPEEDPVAVGLEVARQLERFRTLVGSDPSHLDSHQHVHLGEPARSVLKQISAELSVPLRHVTPGVHHCGAFYGQTGKSAPLPQAITVEALAGILAELPAGVTELGCHPGLGTDYDSVYAAEREIEVRTLCDPKIRDAVAAAGIRLISFADMLSPGLAHLNLTG